MWTSRIPEIVEPKQWKMSVSFNQTQQVVNIEDDGNVERSSGVETKILNALKYFAGNQHLQSPHRVPLDRMTSRSDKNPYSNVQEQLTQVETASREERTERQRIRRIFDKVRLLWPFFQWVVIESFVAFSMTRTETDICKSARFSECSKKIPASATICLKAWPKPSSTGTTMTAMAGWTLRSFSISAKSITGWSAIFASNIAATWFRAETAPLLTRQVSLGALHWWFACSRVALTTNSITNDIHSVRIFGSNVWYSRCVLGLQRQIVYF